MKNWLSDNWIFSVLLSFAVILIGIMAWIVFCVSDTPIPVGLKSSFVLSLAPLFQIVNQRENLKISNPQKKSYALPIGSLVILAASLFLID